MLAAATMPRPEKPCNAKFSPWRGVEIKWRGGNSIGCNFLLCEVSEVQNFERHPRLAQYIERMANTGKTGNTHEWCDFLMLLNTALDDERKRKAPCEQFCEATAFNAEIRRLKAKINDADYLIGAFERGCVSGDYFMDIAHYKGT